MLEKSNKIKMMEALVRLQHAYREVDALWEELIRNDETLADLLNDGYPFDKSFDEVGASVSTWVEAVLDKGIGKKI